MRVAFFSMLVLCLGEAIGGPAYKHRSLQNGRTYIDRPSAKGFILSEFSDSDNVTITIDHSGDAWEGRYYHFSGIDPDTGLREEFTAHIVDHNDDSDFTDAFSLPAPRSPRDTMDLTIQPRFFVCDWYFTCVKGAVKISAISVNAAIIVKNGINTRLRANNNELMKRLVDGVIVGFSVGITSGLSTWYITNRIQGTPDKSSAPDVCVLNDDWTKRIAQLQADIDDMRQRSEAGEYRSRTYVHVSHDSETGADGHNVKHGVFATVNSGDFQPLTC
ncbi:hypothetical protein Hypma_001840 [Hypsizygus marmoreus]|uniref:Uncharacterized protein n=1 Tax=Hypsizygus marmoreus TaxID=39966 RepID=A0A369J9A3_HYPMA|nr:hypothetical protein Hypma_001840 [Hypsizygus marmoreus]